MLKKLYCLSLYEEEPFKVRGEKEVHRKARGCFDFPGKTAGTPGPPRPEVSDAVGSWDVHVFLRHLTTSY